MKIKDGQIAQLYDSGEVSVEDLCLMYPELHRDAIELCLVQNSVLYRKKLKNKEETFSDSAKIRAEARIEQMLDSTDEHIAFKAAKLVLDEKKGLRDVRGFKNIHLTVQQIQQNIQIDLAEAERAEQRAKQREIIVDERHAHLKEIAA